VSDERVARLFAGPLSDHSHDSGLIQGEPFTLRQMGDGRHGKSLVIPLPNQRALRIGFQWRSWCKLGPRRYTVVASPRFVEQWERMGGTTEQLRETGVKIKGEMNLVESAAVSYPEDKTP
jgi:hypothetical protein